MKPFTEGTQVCLIKDPTSVGTVEKFVPFSFGWLYRVRWIGGPATGGIGLVRHDDLMEDKTSLTVMTMPPGNRHP